MARTIAAFTDEEIWECVEDSFQRWFHADRSIAGPFCEADPCSREHRDEFRGRAGNRARGARLLQAQRVDEEPRQLLHAQVEVAIHEALHEPHLREAVGHGSQPGCGDRGVETLVSESVCLQPTYGVGDLRR